jgi:hypothetical protein
MRNYLKKEGIKSTGKLFAKGTRAIRIIYCYIIIIIQYRTSALLFWQKLFQSSRVVLEDVGDNSVKDFNA